MGSRILAHCSTMQVGIILGSFRVSDSFTRDAQTLHAQKHLVGKLKVVLEQGFGVSLCVSDHNSSPHR